MDPEETSRFYETKINKVFVRTAIHLQAEDSDKPVYAASCVWPLLEAVETILTQLLFTAKNLTPQEYEYIKSEFIRQLAYSKLTFHIEIADDPTDQGRVEVETAEATLRFADSDFPLS